ncbi:MAG: DUF1294 domain-containing protein [Anaerolineae bacterium]|nr:DUF1294 domain-containing protein [Anaerolineae bacterium]
MGGVERIEFLWWYGYDKRAVGAEIPGVGDGALYLLSFMGGWGGAFAAQFLLSHKNQGVGQWGVTAVMMLGNMIFWVWVGGQI